MSTQINALNEQSARYVVIRHARSALLLAIAVAANFDIRAGNYTIVDTNQTAFYNARQEIESPNRNDAFFGQDAHYSARLPSYEDNGDGTVSDLNTGLMWTKDPGEKKSFEAAESEARDCRVGGYEDWRLPTIKELYSLIQFDGVDPGPRSSRKTLKPFIDDTVFNFNYGDESKGERLIDSQFASSTKYTSTTMRGSETVFGVNFADGRIKGYPIRNRRGEKAFYVLYVRGNPEYGQNRFVDNGDGTVTDEATGLTWMKADSGSGMDWPTALAFAETLEHAGHSDWRLPNAKELQSILDYSRSPDSTRSAAIDPVFDTTQIKNEHGQVDYAHYWTSTTHLGPQGGDTAVYFAFGRGLGFMQDRRTGDYQLLDVHGAGTQRSDPKVGDASRFPQGRGPQGDVIRIQNLVRAVRGGTTPHNAAISEPDQKPQIAVSEPHATTVGEMGAAATAKAPRPDRPNFIFILADDMGWTGTSVSMDPDFEASRSDYYQTPTLARLAREGMTFSNAYAPAPLCTPSRASILTGRTPAELHITSPGRSNPQPYHRLIEVENRTQLHESQITMAQALAEQGYATAHFGKWHLGRSNPGDHGFDEHDGSTSNLRAGETAADNPKDIFGLTDRAIAFLNAQSAAGAPFYLQLSHYAVHSPVEAREESIQRFNSSPKGKRHADPEFAAMTWDLDRSINTLLEAVENAGLQTSTYLIFMSDNGASGTPRNNQNQPLRGGKGNLFEGGIKVPLIVTGPGIASGTQSDTLVIGYDLMPTLMELANLEAIDGLAGTSLASLLTGEDDEIETRTIYFHYPHYGQGPRQKPQSAIISGRHKLIMDWESGNTLLFDLKADPTESEDLSKARPDLEVHLRSELESWLTKVDAQIPTPNGDFDPDATPRRGGQNRQAR